MKLKPVYARLSSDDLLKKCLDRKTQNANESLNEMIWNRLSKSVFVGASVLSFSVYDAGAHNNIGSKAAENILQELGMEPGRFFLAGMKKIDKERIAKGKFSKKEEASEEKSSVVTKRQMMTSWLKRMAQHTNQVPSELMFE